MTSPQSRPILVLTTEPLPLPGCPTTGAGLRAWGLAEGLRARGFDVVIAAPDYEAQSQGACEHSKTGQRVRHQVSRPSHVRLFKRGDVGRLLAELNPATVVLQHWGMAREVPELSVPLVIDLAGPHLLERMYWGETNIDRNFSEKLDALRRADFITCSGYYQRHYFHAFIALAGFDLRECEIPVIPFSVPPLYDFLADMSAPHTPCADPTDIRFVYGGAFLAWQDPSKALIWLLEEMERAGIGRLEFYGGAHPIADVSGGKFAGLLKILASHPCVTMRGYVPFDQLLANYRKCSVALDLMARNPERELAFTTRTLIYLYCGLPVIHNNYSELSDIIRGHNCGWTLDPDDEESFRKTIRSILTGHAPLASLRGNAIRAASEYAWDKTIDPLARFCATPRMRAGKTEKLLAIEAQIRNADSIRAERDAVRTDLDTIRGKLLFRIQNRLPRLAPLAAPFVWLCAWPVVAWLMILFRNRQRKSE